MYYEFPSKLGPSVTTTQTPDVTISSPLTPKTSYTLERTTSKIAGPTKKGVEKDERKRPQEKGEMTK